MNDAPRALLPTLAAVCVGWLTVLWVWSPGGLALTFDDSFYYFELGRNLAAGHGSTFDRLNPTNGYHPLWMALCAPIFATGVGGMTGVRVALTLQALLVAPALAWLLGRLPWRPSDDAEVASVATRVTLVATASFLLVPYVAKSMVNGMESAVVVVTHAGLLGMSLAARGDLLGQDTRRRWVFGGLVALAFLSRTDAALMAPLLLLWLAPGILRRGVGEGVARVVPLLLPVTLALGAFLAVNQLTLGVPMQVSGSLKRVAPGASGWALIAGCVLVGLGVRRLVAGDGRWAFGRTQDVLRATGWYAWFLLFLVAYYLGLQTFARLWYFAPAVLWATLLLPAFLLDLADKAREDDPESPALKSVGVALAIPTLVIAGGGAWSWTVAAAPTTLAVRHADWDAAAWMNEHLPPDAIAASWDAGLVGYVADARVVNVDGVVNSPAFVEAMRAGTVPDFLRDAGVGYVVNHSLYADDDCELRDKLAGWVPERADRIELLYAQPFVQTGSLNGGPSGTFEMAACVYEVSGLWE